MNLNMVKKMNILVSDERKMFLNEIRTIDKTGPINFINIIAELALSHQNTEDTFKVYLLSIKYIIGLQSSQSSESHNNKISHIIKLVTSLAKRMAIETFPFYGDMNGIVWTTLSDSNLWVTEKIAIYSISRLIEDEMKNQGIRFTSFNKLLERESLSTKIKVDLYHEFIKEFISK